MSWQLNSAALRIRLLQRGRILECNITMGNARSLHHAVTPDRARQCDPSTKECHHFVLEPLLPVPIAFRSEQQVSCMTRG